MAAYEELSPIRVRDRSRRNEMYRFIFGRLQNDDVPILNRNVKPGIVAHDVPAVIRRKAKNGAADV